MGGEGSMMAANNSLKNNRDLVSKRKERGGLTGSYSNVKLAEFPEATPEQLKEIKERMKREQKQIRKKQIFAMFIIILALFFLYIFN
ncbi:hypothetical protein [Wocania ichthyoenteri]|uniref:hypothetical protein n=1 Tax=Wocania ichthyoenteri TaxID=1230531 RepID=UPI00053E8756|nr:hypothetical protein [Wocania ichthyoenteri]